MDASKILAAGKTLRVRPAAYGLIVNKGRLLVTLLSAEMTHASKWTLPGGGLDPGETAEAGVVREIREETGLDVEVIRLIASQDLLFEHPDRIMVAQQKLFLVRVMGGRLRDEVGGTTERVGWLPIADEILEPAVGLVSWGMKFAKWFSEEQVVRE